MDSTEVSQYDAAGTTLQSHKKSTYQYDDSGIRVAQTELDDVNNDGDFEDVGTDTSERTDYLVDHHNATGYAQVLEEMLDPDGDGNAASQLAKSYTIGHDVFLEIVAGNQLRHLLKDGHGSTRQLVDGFGNVIQHGQTPQIFAYDAYGNPHGFTLAQALTTHLYSGEQTDALTGLQYLRARYYNPATGTFNRLDPFAGNMQDPQSLHKYLYTHAEPVNAVDPLGFGRWFLHNLGRAVEKEVFGVHHIQRSSLGVVYDKPMPGIFGGALKPDIMDYARGQIAEIKPLSAWSYARGEVQLRTYLGVANGVKVYYKGRPIQLIQPIPHRGPQTEWIRSTWQPGLRVVFPKGYSNHVAVVLGNIDGVVYYHRVRLPKNAAVGLAAAFAIEQYALEIGRKLADRLRLEMRHGWDYTTQLIWEYQTEAAVLGTFAFATGAYYSGLAGAARIAMMKLYTSLAGGASAAALAPV